jgi:Ca-activated chloride channel homolog
MTPCVHLMCGAWLLRTAFLSLRPRKSFDTRVLPLRGAHGTPFALSTIEINGASTPSAEGMEERTMMKLMVDTSGKSTAFRLALVVAVLALGGATAHGAGLLVADGGFGGVLEITEHTVRVTINNGIAVTEVTQIFRNTENREVEALYTFPVPANASVSNFSMWINGQEMVGEVLEKERAREIYESYKRRRKDPGLLEQVDYRTFEMRIYPIAAGAEQRVQITYYQELNHDHDWATYVYPLATATRPTIDAHVSERFALTVSVRSEVPVVEMESASHATDFIFTPHTEAFYEASLETPEGSLARDVVFSYHLSRPRTGVDLITSRQGNEDGYFCMTVTAGEELAGLVSGMDYVFVLDVSGSMGADRKLDTSGDAVAAFIESLGEEDRFEVMTFNVQPTTLFGALEPVSDGALTRAAEFVASQNAKGGTVLQSAMQTAYQYADPEGDRQLNVVVLSDGLTEQRDRPVLIQLIRGRPQNARVFCVGVGNDVNRPLLEQIAEEAGGLAALISRGDNFDRQAQAFRRKLTRPVATDLQIGFAGGDVYDVVPEVLPNLYHGTPVRLYGRYASPGAVRVAISANVAGHGLDQDLDVNLPATDPANPEIERMWAWHRVQRLLKQADAAGDRSQVVDEIVRLGEGFSIATEYTSFLVLENNEEYARWKIERRNALRIERDRQAQQALRDEFDALRLASAKNLGPVQAEEKQPEQQAKQPSTTPAPQTARRQNAPAESRGFDLDFGGGAIDPISGSIAAGLAGLAAAAWRRKRNS